MSQTPKKQGQTFLHGAALLAMATAIVKIIGALYKLPLKAVIDDVGYSYFCTAYDIYTVLLMISTAGLPVAMSRMISQAGSLGKYNQVRQVYRTAKILFIILGVVSSLLMILFCRQLAAFQQQPDAWAAILCLGPCAFLMGLISTYRGFFQGQGDMVPTSVSQVLEAIFKLVIGLGLAIGVMALTGQKHLAAAGAILGVTVSCGVSSLYLFACFRKSYKELPKTDEEITTFGLTTRQLLSIAIPITIGSAGLQILTVLETNLYMGQLLTSLEGNLFSGELRYLLDTNLYTAYTDHALTTQEQYQYVADNMKGIYNLSQTIYNLPCAFITPITVSIIPAITRHLTLANDDGVRQTEESSARITGLLSLPCAVGLFLLSEPIMALLGGYTGMKLELAAKLMSLMAISVFLHAIVLLTNAIMQSHGRANIPVVNVLCSGVVRLAVVFFLSGIPSIGILGVPLGSAVCNLCICVLNLIAIRRCIPQKPALVRNFLRPLLPTLLMGAVAWGAWKGVIALLGADTSAILLCGIPLAAAGVTYLVSVILFKAITKEDCLLLPKGEKIAKLLHL